MGVSAESSATPASTTVYTIQLVSGKFAIEGNSTLII